MLAFNLFFACVSWTHLSLSASHCTASEVKHLEAFMCLLRMFPTILSKWKISFWPKYLERFLSVSFLFLSPPPYPLNQQIYINLSGPKRCHSNLFPSPNASSCALCFLPPLCGSQKTSLSVLQPILHHALTFTPWQSGFCFLYFMGNALQSITDDLQI